VAVFWLRVARLLGNSIGEFLVGLFAKTPIITSWASFFGSKDRPVSHKQIVNKNIFYQIN
jgi:hypothetical protein